MLEINFPEPAHFFELYPGMVQAIPGLFLFPDLPGRVLLLVSLLLQSLQMVFGIKGHNMTLPFGANNLVVGAILLGVLGIVECFFGYRLFRIVLAILGFFIGVAFAVGLIHSDQTVVVALIALISGLIGGLLFYYLYFVGTFLAGIGLGATFGALLAANLNLTTNVGSIIVVVGAVIGGILGIALSKYIIMFSTAFTGAAQIVYAAVLLLPGTRLVQGVNQVEIRIGQTQWLIMTLAILLLGAVGFAVQLNIHRRVALLSDPRPVA